MFTGLLIRRNMNQFTGLRSNLANIQYLKSASGESLAYEKIDGSLDLPTLLYIPGYGSGKDGDKVVFLKSVAAEIGCGFIRYDPFGVGESNSKNTPFEDIDLKDWVLSARDILTTQGEPRNILVGSSMGGFISLLLAADPTLKSSIAGLLLVAPAVNFYSVLYKSICSQLPKEVIEDLEAGGLYKYENEYGSRTIRKSFFDSAAELEFKGEIHVDVPVSILHGVKDETVPFKNSLQIIENITSKDVELTYVKESTHRFQDPASLKLLKDAVLKMVEKTKRTATDR